MIIEPKLYIFISFCTNFLGVFVLDSSHKMSIVFTLVSVYYVDIIFHLKKWGKNECKIKGNIHVMCAFYKGRDSTKNFQKIVIELMHHRYFFSHFVLTSQGNPRYQYCLKLRLFHLRSASGAFVGH